MLSNAELEQVVLTIRARQDAAGVLLLICNKEMRAEIVAALSDQLSGLPAMLRRMADEIEAGDGIPLGGDGGDGTQHPG